MNDVACRDKYLDHVSPQTGVVIVSRFSRTRSESLVESMCTEVRRIASTEARRFPPWNVEHGVVRN
jgi:hypothetical protein